VRISGIFYWRGLLCCALAAALVLNASVIIQLKVIEGEGMVYRTGSRASRGLTVLVTDEAGKPVANAAVSFRLPESGPSGVFSTGLRTEIVKTGPDGRAMVSGMQWNKTQGPMEIRITAVKDQARAGMVSTQYLNDAAVPQAASEGVFKASHRSKTKWFLIGAAVAGAAAAGVALGGSHSANPSAPAAVAAGISIGSPSIIVGHP
jgi:hypothetical protein